MIDEFKGKYYFLSNFYPHTFWYKGIKYKNSEAAFQAQKNILRSKDFSNLTASKAKYLGKRVELRKDWDKVKLSIMRDILQSKFSDEKLKKRLISTYPHKLVEGNDWNDDYWGVILETGKGENNLGKILEDLRTQYLR